MKTKKSKKTPPVVRDRIVELCRVRAGELRRHPQNWRLHPPAQQAAMAKVLGEVGYADALVARRLADGTLELIDGHLRAATTPDVEVPVLVVDLDDREAALLLAVHDSLTGMAEWFAAFVDWFAGVVDWFAALPGLTQIFVGLFLFTMAIPIATLTVFSSSNRCAG